MFVQVKKGFMLVLKKIYVYIYIFFFFTVSCDVQEATTGQVSRDSILENDRAHVRMLLLA